MVYECPIKKIIFLNFLGLMCSFSFKLIISMNFSLKKSLNLIEKNVSGKGFEPMSSSKYRCSSYKEKIRSM